MPDKNDSTRSTNRRSVLNTVASTAIASSLFVGAASAAKTSTDGSGSGPEYCETQQTQYRCADAGCNCNCGGCDCDTVQEQRVCCVDPYGNIVSCGPWSSTGTCCSSC